VDDFFRPDQPGPHIPLRVIVAVSHRTAIKTARGRRQIKIH